MTEAPTSNSATSLFMRIVGIKVECLSRAKVAVSVWTHRFGPACDILTNQWHHVAVINEGRNSDRRSNTRSGSWRGYIDEFSRNLRVSRESLSELCENFHGKACGNEKAEDSSLHFERKKRHILATRIVVRSF